MGDNARLCRRRVRTWYSLKFLSVQNYKILVSLGRTLPFLFNLQDGMSDFSICLEQEYNSKLNKSKKRLILHKL